MANIDYRDNASVVVLAAGMSSRMGKQNKLHLKLNGQALLRYSVQRFLEMEFSDVVVVVGYEGEDTAELIGDLNVTTVLNPSYADGQITSVRCGLAGVKRDSSATFIALGDQPAVTKDSIEVMLCAFKNRGKAESVVPYFDGKRGNPVLISANARKQILAGKGNYGCRKFMDRNPDLVCRINVQDAGVITDLDTPQEYHDYCSRLMQGATST